MRQNLDRGHIITIMLAQMGQAFALQPDRPANETIHELKELQIARTALVKDRTRLLNRIKTQALSLTERHSKARLAQIERQLAAIQTEIETRLRGDDGKARKGGSCATPSICLPSSPCASTSRCRKNTRR